MATSTAPKTPPKPAVDLLKAEEQALKAQFPQFNYFDRDGDGTLGVPEIRSMLELLGYDITDAFVDQVPSTHPLATLRVSCPWAPFAVSPPFFFAVLLAGLPFDPIRPSVNWSTSRGLRSCSGTSTRMGTVKWTSSSSATCGCTSRATRRSPLRRPR